MIRWIKRLFGIYECGCEYWVYVKDIKVNPEWRKTEVREKKMKFKLAYWQHTGNFHSKVILDQDFHLLDGYSTLRIAEMNHIDKIPVYFVKAKEK